MFVHSAKYPGFAILSLLLVSVAGTKAQAQGSYELRCRGGSGAFSVDQLYTNTFSLSFTAAARAATTSAGLNPGTCAWLDRAVNTAEPRTIHFTAVSWQATLIAQQLSDPNNYWAFFVVNTNQGFFDAKSQGPITKADSPAQTSANADITAQTSKAGVTPRQGPATRADITPRRPILNPSSIPATDKRGVVGEQSKLVQIFRDVKVEEITASSFTVSFTTTRPATSEVRVGIWSYYFSLDGKKHWVLDQDVEYDAGGVTVNGPYMQSDHRITIRLRRDMVSGERRQLLIYARSAEGERFDYEQIFTTP